MKNALFGSGIKTLFSVFVLALLALGVVAAAYATGAFGGSSPTAEAGSSAGPTSTPAPSGSPGPTTPADVIVAPRPVTTGAGVPAANQLHDAQFTSVTSGWVVTAFDTGTFDSSHDPVLGQRILYLISPTGDRYELGVFDASQQVDPAAWNVAQGKILLEIGGAHYAVYDIATGTLGPDWALCGDHPVTAFITPQDDGAWAFRGFCIGAQVDGVYDDTGADVTPAAYYRAPFERWDVTLPNGEVVIYWPGHTPSSLIASAPAPSEPEEMLFPDGTDSCAPVGLGRGNSVAVSCNTGDKVSAWEMGPQIFPPAQLANESAVLNFTSSALGGGDIAIAKNCVIGNREVLEIQGNQIGAGIVDNGTITQPMLGSVGAEHCWGAAGDVGLFSGHGNLWTTTFGGIPCRWFRSRQGMPSARRLLGRSSHLRGPIVLGTRRGPRRVVKPDARASGGGGLRGRRGELAQHVVDRRVGADLRHDRLDGGVASVRSRDP